MDITEQRLRIRAAGTVLEADTIVPGDARGMVLFTPGGGSWFRRRSRHVAAKMCDAGLGVMLAELITPVEAERGTIELEGGPLSSRVTALIDWVAQYRYAEGLGLGVYGTSTAVTPVLIATAARPYAVQAVVTRGGRPELAGRQLERIHPPTLLIVGGNDVPGLARARATLQRLPAERCLKIVSGASHLFNEPGTVEQAAILAREWFLLHLRPVPGVSAHD